MSSSPAMTLRAISSYCSWVNLRGGGRISGSGFGGIGCAGWGAGAYPRRGAGVVEVELHYEIPQFHAVAAGPHPPAALQRVDVVENWSWAGQCAEERIPMKTGVLVEQVEQLRAIAFLLVRQLSAAQGFERLCLLLSSRVGWN